MDITKFLVLFYKEQHYIFGICPCCNKIFQLSAAALFIMGKKVTLPELGEIIEEQEKLDSYKDRVKLLGWDFNDIQNDLSDKQEQYEKVEPIYTRKVVIKGRRQAVSQIKKIGMDKTFLKLNIYPKDARLLFSPVEFVVFHGMTSKDDVEKISFMSRRAKSRADEKIQSSIERTIENGNLEFVLIRADADERGKISYRVN